MSALSAEERDAFRAVVRAFVDERSPTTRARTLSEAPDAVDDVTWIAMAEELGLQGIEIPEHLGGSGLGFGEVALAQEELGRRLVCSPFLASSVLATGAIIGGADAAAREELLPALAAGTTVATVVHGDRSCGWEPAGEVRGRREAGRHVLNGEVRLVPDLLTADLLIVLAAAEAGPSLFLVDAASTGVARSPEAALDGTRRLGSVAFDGVTARLLGEEGSAAAVAELLVDRAAVALAAEQVGAARVLLDLSVRHALTREQFGHPIGAFQAVKHACARILIDSGSAAAVAAHAARSVEREDGGPERGAIASLAKVHCCQMGVRVASATIHLHGGLGFTWEHDAHLYYRRALSSEQLFGGLAWHRERMVRHLETSLTDCFA